MTSYTRFVDFASAAPAWMPGEAIESTYGDRAASAGNVQRHPDGWQILDGTYRTATPMEVEGIERRMVKMAEALVRFGAIDTIEAALADTLASYEPVQPGSDDEWNAWLDAMADDWADTYASIRCGFSMF